MDEKTVKDLNEGDLPRTPPGRPVAISPGSNQAKEPLSDCVQRRLLANMRQGMTRAKAAVAAIRSCEKSRPVQGKTVVHVDKAGEGESVKDCVSRKIAILIREGKSKEQAAAIAFSLCKGKK